MMRAIFPQSGSQMIAIAIMISAFGCMNGMILSGARAYYAMALDGLFFKKAAYVNRSNVPSSALVMQGAWTAVLVLVRTYNSSNQTYGNLYSNLLDYVVSAALVFYILTIAGVFRLRRLQPDTERPYRAFGYPIVPILYIIFASIILLLLLVYRPTTTVPGIIIVTLGVPVYFLFRAGSRRAESSKQI
jgi:APA family basic amino acid/polyamine antiporter